MQDPPRSRRRASSRSARSRKRLLSPSITAELTCVSSPPTPGETDARRSDSQGVEAHPFALGTIARSTILSSSAASRRFCFRGSIPSLCAPLSTFVRLAAGGRGIRTVGPSHKIHGSRSRQGEVPKVERSGPEPWFHLSGTDGSNPSSSTSESIVYPIPKSTEDPMNRRENGAGAELSAIRCLR
jgi:hypothetical protein